MATGGDLPPSEVTEAVLAAHVGLVFRESWLDSSSTGPLLESSAVLNKSKCLKAQALAPAVWAKDLDVL